MNTGIAIVLNDVLPGESILGNVTLVESAARKIAHLTANYCEALGTDAYRNQISTLFTSIVNDGLDSKLFGLYPILGDTLLKQKINAINPGTFDLNLGANASVSDKGLLFSHDIAVGDMTLTTSTAGDGSSLSQLSVIYADNLSQNTSCVSCYIKTIANAAQSRLSLGTYSVGGIRKYCVNRRTDSLDSIYNTIGSSPSCFVMRFDENGITTQFNSDEPVTSAFDFSSDLYKTYANNALGYEINYSESTGTSGEPATSSTAKMHLFGGHVYFHALGSLSLVELGKLKSAVATFLASAKQIELL